MVESNRTLLNASINGATLIEIATAGTITTTVNRVENGNATMTLVHKNNDAKPAQSKKPRTGVTVVNKSAKQTDTKTSPPISLTVTTTGDVTKCQGMPASMRHSMDQNQTGTPSAVRQAVLDAFADDRADDCFDTGLYVLPDRPVAIGETWKTSCEMFVPTFGTLPLESTFNLRSVDEKTGIATIERVAKVVGSPVCNPDLTGGVDFTLKGATGSGLITFDLNKGVALSQSMKLVLTLQTKRGEQIVTMPTRLEFQSTLTSNKLAASE